MYETFSAIIIVSIHLALIAICARMTDEKGRGLTLGIWLGGLLSLVGLLIVVLIPPKNSGES
ncbi:MAG: hypothetical protein AB7L91_08080 [Dehalococcoidia bacterium]